jgi:hypothetical protein
MNWPSELMIKKSNHNASSGIEIDRLIAYKPLVDEAIELLHTDQKK